MSFSLDIGNLERLYGEGETTPAEIVREVYTRIRKKGAHPDWITLADEDTAVARARTAPRGPLHGIPFAVKDNTDAAGLPTTCACPEFAYVPDRSATVVERLEQAGAILIGKTNLDQFATGLNGTRSPYGIPTSTFNSDYISGGSSSGSAVVVAAGLVSFALGTDTAGSGRIPAAFNNIVGLKPTKGLISMRSVVPACRTQDAVSIFALTVADAARVASSAIAFDPEDNFARVNPPRFMVSSTPKPLRVGIPQDDIEFFGDTSYAALYRAAAARMAALGAKLVSIDFAPFQQAATLLYGGPWVAERLVAVGDLIDRNPTAIHPVVRSILLGARHKTAADTFAGFYRLSDLVSAAQSEWTKMDLLMLPTAPTIFTIAEMLADPVELNSRPRRLYQFRQSDGPCGARCPSGFSARWITLRRDSDRARALRRHARFRGRHIAQSARRCIPRRYVVFFINDARGACRNEHRKICKGRCCRRASQRPAAQRPACRAKRKTSGNHTHRFGLSALRTR